jgi:hypothetical protein
MVPSVTPSCRTFADWVRRRHSPGRSVSPLREVQPRDERTPRRAVKCILLAATLLGAATAVQSSAHASSHREAPMIAGMPRLDASDFFFFRSYEPGRQNYVTMIADYLPLQDPAGGPNFFNMEHNGYYDINVDSNATGQPYYTFRFRFKEVSPSLSVPVGGVNVPIALINDGQIVHGDHTKQNSIEFYTISLVTYDATGAATETPLQSASGQTSFQKPVDNIGDKSVPNYPEYARAYTYEIAVPNCGLGRVFVGQRKDPFVINLGETFDLVNYAHPIGEKFAASAKDDLAAKNVTSLVMEVPTACLTNPGNPVLGAWTTSSVGTTTPNGQTTYQQVSRLANPLVNELVIGLKDKDKFNMSQPANDAQFAIYVTNPTVPALIQALFPGVTAPTKFPRADLEAVFLTGIKGLNQHLRTTPSEEMRLNTNTPIIPYGSQNRLGVIAGDKAGYPNGRRPGDDVVDITLRVAMGKLYTLGLYGNPSDAPSGSLEFTDGAYTDSTHFLQTFPYVMPPLSPSPQSGGSVPVSVHEPQ